MTTPINDGGHAFPFGNPTDGGAIGMTLRDYFAGSIAIGMSSFTGTKGEGYGPGSIAQRSYEIADAMLAERAKATS